MIKQLIVAAGGIGSRVSASLNGHKSKALMESGGKPLIQHLLESAQESGLQEFFISVNENNREKIEAIANSLEISYRTSLTGEGFQYVPHLFRADLDDRVLIACGHHFIPPHHFQELLDYSKQFDAVFSAYQDPPYSMDKRRRILVHGIDDLDQVRFERVDLDKDPVPESHRYVRNPYVVTTHMIDKVKENGFTRSVGFFVYRHWENGGRVAAVDSIMPPEFDYDHEFERTKQFMDRYFGGSR